MISTDLVKEDKEYYAAKKTPEIREFAELQFLTILGKGQPAGAAFTKAVEALYPLAYGIRKVCKSKEMIFSVPKLEGLWWVDSDKTALEVPRSEWCWKLLIRMPDFVTDETVDQARREVMKTKGIKLLEAIQFEGITEGKCVQILHVGPYATEPDTIQIMQDFIKERGLKENGFHHEIYLSDPRKTEPQKMKTILRQPVRK
ncbi:MAG: GyrI-like domain-containing protein [Saprospiraceae bacterium]|nr:GyrI-like domain-containing protein [Saprospiraceae bacterium]